ncbi:MAG: O-methyltransferase [Thermodesulfobacteriota bacterium]
MSYLVSNPEEYFGQFVSSRSDLLLQLEDEARQEDIPIIGPVVGELLYILARTSQASRILELGTAIGYSTLFLGSACVESGGLVSTLESNPGLAQRARENCKRAGLESHIDVINQDALEAMDSMQKQGFDLAFLDIDKIYYEQVLDRIKPLLRKGGMLIVDNTGFKEADGFNKKIHSDPEWRQVQLYSLLPLHSPQWDGLCLALRS